MRFHLTANSSEVGEELSFHSADTVWQVVNTTSTDRISSRQVIFDLAWCRIILSPPGETCLCGHVSCIFAKKNTIQSVTGQTYSRIWLSHVLKTVQTVSMSRYKESEETYGAAGR